MALIGKQADFVRQLDAALTSLGKGGQFSEALTEEFQFGAKSCAREPRFNALPAVVVIEGVVAVIERHIDPRPRESERPTAPKMGSKASGEP